MDTLSLVVAALFAAGYAAVGIGVFRVFHVPGDVPRALWWVRTVVVAADVAACAVLALHGTPGALPAALGLLMMVASVAQFAWCARATARARFSIAFADDEPRHVQRDGPYALARHPFYAGYVLSYVAAVVASGEPLLLCAVAAVAGVFHAAARFEEEKFRRSALAAEYADYARVTGMYLPRRWGLLAVMVTAAALLAR